jgi:hypothetical protein
MEEIIRLQRATVDEHIDQENAQLSGTAGILPLQHIRVINWRVLILIF